MEIDRRTLEIAASIVFIVLLILIAVSVIDKNKNATTNLQKQQDLQTAYSNPTTSGQIINNYYYGNYYENYNSGDSYSQRYQSANSPSCQTSSCQEINYRDNSGQTTEKEFLNNYITTYYVDIANRASHGMYFTVIFTFKDKNDFTFSERVTLYLRPGETKRFSYRDFQYEKNEIVDWEYRVLPRSA